MEFLPLAFYNENLSRRKYITKYFLCMLCLLASYDDVEMEGQVRVLTYKHACGVLTVVSIA